MDSDMLGEASYNTSMLKPPFILHGPSAVCGFRLPTAAAVILSVTDPAMNEQERQMPLMPDFWLIIMDSSGP